MKVNAQALMPGAGDRWIVQTFAYLDLAGHRRVIEGDAIKMLSLKRSTVPTSRISGWLSDAAAKNARMATRPTQTVRVDYDYDSSSLTFK